MSSPHLMKSAVFVLVIFLCMCSVYCRNLDSTETINNCLKVKPFFDSLNVSSNLQLEGQGPRCSGSCCSATTELLLAQHARGDFQRLLRHNSQSLQGLFETTASTLREHVTELSRQSENKTLNLFAQVYRRMSALSSGPITYLYSNIRRHIETPENINTEHSILIDSGNSNLESSIKEFFTELFPLAYHHAVHSRNNDFTPDYKSCLRQTFDEIKPFGDIPHQISKSLYRSLEATRVLLQALALGADVLGSTDNVLANEENTSCQDALLKMSYCPRCQGLNFVRPCSGYCLNVLRGCLTAHVGGLDSPWNGFVEGVERLVLSVRSSRYGVEGVVRGLDTRVSEAIMHAMENGPKLEKQVKRSCGHPKMSDTEDPLMANTTNKPSNLEHPKTMINPQRLPTANMRISPPDAQMLHFLASVDKSRGFYANLADSLCQDDSFAETKDGADCWNGERIGEYTKTVAPVSIQKYNPEVNFSAKETPSDAKVAKLADQLRHIRQVVVSALSQNPDSESHLRDVQGDEAGLEAGLEGSGSGKGSWDEEDQDWSEGSGSGDGVDDGDVNKILIDKTRIVESSSESPKTGDGGAGVSLIPTLYCTTLGLVTAVFTYKMQYV